MISKLYISPDHTVVGVDNGLDSASEILELFGKHDIIDGDSAGDEAWQVIFAVVYKIRSVLGEKVEFLEIAGVEVTRDDVRH